MWWWVILTITLLYILSWFSRPVNYICKTILYALVFLILAVAHLIYCPFFPRNRDNTYVLAPLFYWLSYFATGIWVEAEGTEYIESYDGGYILASNHQSALDTHCIARIWPHRAIIMMKKSLMYVPFFGWAAYLSGHEFIERSSGGSNSVRDHMNQINERIKTEKLRVVVFPEGTRNRDSDQMLPFKKGGFHMAQQSQSPIVPVCISNVRNIYSKKNWLFLRGTLKVRVLAPIPTVGLTADDVSVLAERVRKLMQENLDDMNKSL